MKFPGRRISKHYFPVEEPGHVTFKKEFETDDVYIVGIDQLLVDIEAHVDDKELLQMGLSKGESCLLDDDKAAQIYSKLKDEGGVCGEFAGGSIGNTLHNYTAIADDHAFLLGAITRHITVGDDAFHYVRNTSSRVSMDFLHSVEGPMGRALCCVTPDGERSFGISRGIMDEFPREAVPEKLIKDASALVLTSYLLRDDKAPIFAATMYAIDLANKHGVPVVLSLGTSSLVTEKLQFFRQLIEDKIQIVAGNRDEFAALTGEKDPLLAGQTALDICDLVLLTHDAHGLYICGYTEQSTARKTGDKIHSKSLSEYNKFEYSRPMLKRECAQPLKIYSHIGPYHIGSIIVRNTNGAGDAALAAVLHDLAANVYHQLASPTSPKHKEKYLTYSSIHQIGKYANRVSYEVLRRNAPRLVRGLPEQEDSLEQAYWEA